jgi:hypothetical protein
MLAILYRWDQKRVRKIKPSLSTTYDARPRPARVVLQVNVKQNHKNNFTKKKKRCCKNLPMWYSLIMENEMNAKELQVDDLSALASDNEKWEKDMAELEAIVAKDGNPNIWID